MSSTLSAHSPKFQSQLVTREFLHAMPAPQALGIRHKPVPHSALVDAIDAEVIRRGYAIEREQLAVGAKGAALFGVLDITPAVPVIEVDARPGRGLAFGFRNSTDQTMAIRAVAGNRVFVCDNMSMSGETFAISRKNTSYLDLADAVARGFDKFLVHIGMLDLEIARLESKYLTDGQAKEVIFDVFAAGIVPVRLFDDVNRFYFKPTDAMTDCQPRTLFGAQNAFTRAMQDLKATRQLGAGVALGKHFSTLVS